MQYTYGDPYGFTPPQIMDTSQYTLTPIYIAESSLKNEDITNDLVNDDTTTKYKFIKPSSGIQTIGTKTSLFEIRFIDDGNITTDVASTIKLIEIQFEPTDPFPTNVMLTNISGPGNRGYILF